MEKKIRVAPSLLAADFLNLKKEMQRILLSKADWVHLDIMDGHFVPNISFGLPIVSCLKSIPIFKDVHLMIENPHQYALSFIEAGADLITFHYEAYRFKKDRLSLIKQIKNKQTFVAMSIKPNTPIDVLFPYLKQLDLVLIMSVEPGFGGQKYLENATQKVIELRKYIDKHHLNCLIEIDGGINETTAKKAIKAGCDVLVAGSYLFDGNMKEKISQLKKKEKDAL